MSINNFEYDVVLSFAGEDRVYVENVANFLADNDIQVFYDKYDEIELWGKDLYIHFDEIYRHKARYCVIFISENYKKKLWATHELKSAFARAFQENEEYILPARFDDTDIPGLRPTIGYISLKELAPERFGEMILQKLNREIKFKPSEVKEEFRIPKITPKSFNPFDEAFKFIEFVSNELNKRCQALANDGITLASFEREGRRCYRIVQDGHIVYSLDISMGGIGGDASLNFYGVRGEVSSFSNSINAWGNIVWDINNNRTVLQLTDLSLFRFLADSNRMTNKEFVDNLWEVICNAIEGN